MRKFAPILAVLLVFGCAAKLDTPEKVVAAADVTYASALDAVADAYRNGDISADYLVNTIEPRRVLVKRAIDEARRLVDNGDPDAYSYATAALNLAVSFSEAFGDGVPE